MVEVYLVKRCLRCMMLMFLFINLSFSMICNKEELNELLKCYDKNNLNVKEIPNAKLSECMETCFCPNCMRMEFIKEGNIVHTCKECGRKYFIKF